MDIAQARTLKLALEARLKTAKPLPCTHPIVAWLFEHAAWTLSNCTANDNGRTQDGRLHGHEARERVSDFGERVLFYIPKKSRANLDVRWK